jgi:hypothetical protein
MTPVLLLALLVWQSSADPGIVAEPKFFRYERPVAVSGTGQACAVLDGEIFPHAAPSLRDLRLFAGVHEIPFAVTLSEAAQPQGDPAHVLNLGRAPNGDVTFDLEMPARPYTEVTLDLPGKDFVATATISGMEDLHGAQKTAIGSSTLFDLTTQRLGRSTTLSLPESSFRYLHVTLHLSGAGYQPFAAESGMVRGAEVPPSREAQTLYTPVARTASFSQRGRETVATFQIGARIPVEQVTVQPAPGFSGNFSRAVRVTARPNDTQTGSGAMTETLDGTILRVHRGDISKQELSFPASLGANLQGSATVEVAIENGDDQPLPVAAISLSMRERRVCFDAPSTAPTLFYGDPALAPPVYDYSRLFTPAEHPIQARLGPEIPNPESQPRADQRPFTERHPDLLWLALLVVVALLGTVALRSSRRISR